MSSRGRRGGWKSWDGNQWTFNKPPRRGCGSKAAIFVLLIGIHAAIVTWAVVKILT